MLYNLAPGTYNNVYYAESQCSRLRSFDTDAITDMCNIQCNNDMLHFSHFTSPVARALVTPGDPTGFSIARRGRAYYFAWLATNPVRSRVEVLDPTGRIVAVLCASPRDGGVCEARWDGRGAGDSPVSCGSYLVGLALDGGKVWRRLAVTR